MVVATCTAASASPSLSCCEREPESTSTFSKVRKRCSPNCFLAAAAGVMLASATFDTMATKFMNRQQVPPCPDCTSRYFEAPFLQTWTGYLGEFMFFPLYLLDRARVEKAASRTKLNVAYAPHLEQTKSRCPPWQWIVPLSLDLSSTVFLNYATLLIQASAVQILRSFNIMITLLLSLFVLRNQLLFHQALGVGMALLGIVSAACFAMLHPDTETNYGAAANSGSGDAGGSKTAAWLGVCAALLGTTLGSVQWILEERLFRKYSCSPIEAVAWMGLFGVIIGGLLLQLAHLTGLEDVRAAFFQMSLQRPESRNLLIFNVLYIFSLAINTAAGITITKLASSLLRAMVNAGRAVSIWLMEMLVGWQEFKVLSGLGLLLVVGAIFVYNYNFFGRPPSGHWFCPLDATLRRAVCVQATLLPRGETEGTDDAGSDADLCLSPAATTARASSRSSDRNIFGWVPVATGTNDSPSGAFSSQPTIRRFSTPFADGTFPLPVKISGDSGQVCTTPIRRANADSDGEGSRTSAVKGILATKQAHRIAL